MLRQASTLFSRHGGGERTLVICIEYHQVVVKRRSLIVSLVYGFRCLPSLSGCRCLYIIRFAYTWNPTVRRDQQTYTIMKKIHSGEPVNIHIQSLINIIQENNWVITTKKGKNKLSLFCGNGKRVIPIFLSIQQASPEYFSRTYSMLVKVISTPSALWGWTCSCWEGHWRMWPPPLLMPHLLDCHWKGTALPLPLRVDFPSDFLLWTLLLIHLD